MVTSVIGEEVQCACTSLGYTTVRFVSDNVTKYFIHTSECISFLFTMHALTVLQDIVGELPKENVRWVAVIGPSFAIICIGITLVLYLSNR